MKISEATVKDVAGYLRLEDGDYTEQEFAPIMEAAKQYIVSYTGLPEVCADAPCIDSYADLTIAYFVLCQSMYDDRSVSAENAAENRTVATILGMHARNLI